MDFSKKAFHEENQIAISSLRFSSVFKSKMYQKDRLEILEVSLTYLFHAKYRKKASLSYLNHAISRKKDSSDILKVSTTYLRDRKSYLFQWYDILVRRLEQGVAYNLESRVTFSSR